MFLNVLIRFYLDLWHRSFLSHYNFNEFIVDLDHPFYRRYTRIYAKKRNIAKNFWLVSGILFVIFPFAAVFFVLFLTSTFASFCVLDETSDR